MNRIGDRTVELTEVEDAIANDARENWEEGTDPQTFVLDQAVVYGETVQDDFVAWLCHSMILGSVHGYAIGTRWDGSTIADVALGPGEHRLTLTLADGRTVSTP